MKPEPMKSRWLLITTLLTIIAVFFFAIQTFGAVTLKYFQVSYEANRVKLRWETATELDNLGFVVKKKITGSNASFETVKLCAKATVCNEAEKVDFVFAEGGNIGKAYGDYFDDDIQPGNSYTYQLIAIDTSQREEVAETKTVQTSNQPVLTRTTASVSPTATVTNSPPTATPRSANPNPPRTRTPTPTATATMRLLQPTPTPLPSATSQPPTEVPEPEVTETVAELIIPTLPLPSITLIFPDTPTPYLEAPTETPQAGSIPQNATGFTPARLLVIGLIVMAWGILGGWFIFALRKIQ